MMRCWNVNVDNKDDIKAVGQVKFADQVLASLSIATCTVWPATVIGQSMRQSLGGQLAYRRVQALHFLMFFHLRSLCKCVWVL